MSGAGVEHSSNKVRFQVYLFSQRERGGEIGNKDRLFLAFFFLQVSRQSSK